MAKRKYKDYGIRPKGSPEVACDPCILIQITAKHMSEPGARRPRQDRVIEVYNFLIKTALTVLPPKQRKIFYSVWVRSGGKMNKGIMEYSRKVRQSHYTNYNNYYKAVASLQSYLKKTGYDDHIIAYLNGEGDDDALSKELEGGLE